jgi:hypothetical protein
MALRYPGERTFKTLIRRNDHDAHVLALLRLGPKRIYAGLLWIRDQRKYRPGWEKHAFREFFGTDPRPRDKGAPARPPIELEEWINTRQRRRRPKARGTAA